MPPLSTHFRLATLILAQLRISSHIGSFLLGTTAPDTFEADREASFSQYHFRATNGQISLERFLKQTNFALTPPNSSSWSFNCGYYSHLWLDVFYRDHADCLPFKRSAGMAGEDWRRLLRRETEILNAPFVLEVGKLQICQSEKFLLPTGLEFVHPEQCTRLFYEVVKQSQAWSQSAPTSETITAAEYAAFFERASELFASEIQNIP